MKCVVCKQEIKDDSKFCPKCGKAIPRCPGCGKVLTKRTRFCTNDGTSIPEDLLALIPEQNVCTGGQEMGNTSVGFSKERKKNGFVVAIAVIAAVVVLSGAGFTGYLVMKNGMPSFISKIINQVSDADLKIRSGDIQTGKNTLMESNTDTEQTDELDVPAEIKQQPDGLDDQEEIEKESAGKEEQQPDIDQQTGTNADLSKETEEWSDIDNTSAGADQQTDTNVVIKEDAEESKIRADLQKFGIDSSSTEDYGAVLDPDTYQYYDSGIRDFSFYYPAELYNDVVYNEEPAENAYGTNVESICFKASGGSELIFTISKRKDDLSLEQITNHIYENESASMIDAAKLVLSAEADYGRVIMTGYTIDKSKLIYDMVKAESDYVLHMKVIFPQYTGEEDQLQKGYVTECIYRLCGFSGSSKMPRSYQEYKKGQ